MRVLVDRVSWTEASGNVARAILRAVCTGATTGLCIAVAGAADAAARTNFARGGTTGVDRVARICGVGRVFIRFGVAGAGSVRRYVAAVGSWLGAIADGTYTRLAVAPFRAIIVLIALPLFALVSRSLVCICIRVVFGRLILIVLIALTAVAVPGASVWFRPIALGTNARLALASLRLAVVVVLIALTSTLVALFSTLVALILVPLAPTLVALSLIALASALVALISLSLIALVALTAALTSALAVTLTVALAAFTTALASAFASALAAALAAALTAALAFTLAAALLVLVVAQRGRGRGINGRPEGCLGGRRTCGSAAGSDRDTYCKNDRSDRCNQIPAMTRVFHSTHLPQCRLHQGLLFIH